MYVNRMLKSVVALAGAAVILTACADDAKSPTMAPDVNDVFLTLGTAQNSLDNGVVETEFLKVCKVYAGGGPMPTVTINVSAVDNDNPANVGNTSVTLSDGQCRNVWIAGGTGATVTATEVVPTDYVAAWEKWDDLGDNLEVGTLDASGSGNSASGVLTGSVPVGGAGATIRFTNRYSPPPPPGSQGCTPGYWKQSQHFGSWVTYDQDDLFETVFGRNVPGNPTLLDALGANGGGINALMRHSVAALLNAASGSVNYGATPAEVIAAFQAAYDSDDLETQKNIFAGWNERGCPLARAE